MPASPRRFAALAAGLALLLGLPGGVPAQQGDVPAPRSVYTPLSGAQCRLLRSDPETGSTVHRCPGVGGYALEVSDDDARMSAGVVAPGGRVHRLDYWSVVTRGFSSLGPRAEWRVRGEGRSARPFALIVRVNASEHPDQPERVTSYLAVARITAGRICVTDRIAPSADANVQARRAADRPGAPRCLPPLSVLRRPGPRAVR